MGSEIWAGKYCGKRFFDYNCGEVCLATAIIFQPQRRKGAEQARLFFKIPSKRKVNHPGQP